MSSGLVAPAEGVLSCHTCGDINTGFKCDPPLQANQQLCSVWFKELMVAQGLTDAQATTATAAQDAQGYFCEHFGITESSLLGTVTGLPAIGDLLKGQLETYMGSALTLPTHARYCWTKQSGCSSDAAKAELMTQLGANAGIFEMMATVSTSCCETDYCNSKGIGKGASISFSFLVYIISVVINC